MREGHRSTQNCCCACVDAYAGSDVRFVDWLTAAVGVCGGIYLVNSARRLGKGAPKADTTKKG